MDGSRIPPPPPRGVRSSRWAAVSRYLFGGPRPRLLRASLPDTYSTSLGSTPPNFVRCASPGRGNLRGNLCVYRVMSHRPRATHESGLDAEFDGFVIRHAPMLLRMAVLMVGDHGHAEDLLQLTLLRVARRWGVARCAPEAYAHRVLVNLSRDGWRRADRRVREQSLEHAGAFASALDHAETVIARDAVIHALRQLPDRQREVLVLRYFGDLSIAETAAAIGSSEGTVKAYTARALRRMRQLLADDAPGTVQAQMRGFP
jgi:RNA polymerase sigma-70 factor (sigma-E family)